MKWLMYSEFPVIPQWKYFSKEDDAPSFWWFRFLFLTIMNSEYFSLGLSISLEFEGIRIHITLPYLDLAFFLPFPVSNYRVRKIDNYLMRKGYDE